MASHVAASLKLVRAHRWPKNVSIADARELILEAAQRLGTGAAGRESEMLAVRLEKATGCSISELAVYASEWPDP